MAADRLFSFLHPSILKRSSSSPVTTGTLNGLNGPAPLGPLTLRCTPGGAAEPALEAAALYDNLENMVSSPPFTLELAAPQSTVVFVPYGPLPKMFDTPGETLNPPAVDEGDARGGKGGNAWMRE